MTNNKLSTLKRQQIFQIKNCSSKKTFKNQLIRTTPLANCLRLIKIYRVKN